MVEPGVVVVVPGVVRPGVALGDVVLPDIGGGEPSVEVTPLTVPVDLEVVPGVEPMASRPVRARSPAAPVVPIVGEPIAPVVGEPIGPLPIEPAGADAPTCACAIPPRASVAVVAIIIFAIIAVLPGHQPHSCLIVGINGQANAVAPRSVALSDRPAPC